jgi:hypothetical protein
VSGIDGRRAYTVVVVRKEGGRGFLPRTRGNSPERLDRGLPHLRHGIDVQGSDRLDRLLRVELTQQGQREDSDRWPMVVQAAHGDPDGLRVPPHGLKR